MRTCITLPNTEAPNDLSPFHDDCMPHFEPLVRHFIEEYTHPRDVVFDPFAGTGVVMRVAERMGRIPFGLDSDRQRVERTRARMNHIYNIIHGDPRKMTSFGLPTIDFSFTVPPYSQLDIPKSPFPSSTSQQSSYLCYLSELQSIYKQMATLMRPGAVAVIEASNVRTPTGLTPFAWDIGIMVSEALEFEGEVVVNWEPTYGYGYDHSYCLVFRKRMSAKERSKS